MCSSRELSDDSGVVQSVAERCKALQSVESRRGEISSTSSSKGLSDDPRVAEC